MNPYFAKLTAAACLFLLPVQGMAQQPLLLSWTGQPSQYPYFIEPAAITGFGEARFGMGLEEVKAVLARTFPQADIRDTLEAVQQTRVLTLVVPDMAPVAGVASPGPATLNYVFGAHSGALMAINLDWYATGDVTPAQRQALLDAGTAYTANLIGYQWAPLQTARGHVVGRNAVILFAGRDPHQAGVEVRVEGVPLRVVHPDGKVEERAVTEGSARLYIGLSAQPDQPDIFRLPKNAF